MNPGEILESAEWFRGAPVELRREMRAKGQLVRLGAGQVFFNESQVCGLVAMVGSGSLRVFKTALSGRELSLYHVRAGEMCLVNMLSALRQNPVPATARAELPVEAVTFPAAQFRQWVRRYSALQDLIFETASRRVVEVMTLAEEVAFQNMERRLAELLLRLSDRPVGRLRDLSATHEQLASELGTVREVVSRLLKEFERAGAVNLGRGHIELLDAQLLRHFTSEPDLGLKMQSV